jgi:hypothetical protein
MIVKEDGGWERTKRRSGVDRRGKGLEGCAASETSEEMVAVGRDALRVGKTRCWWVLGMKWVGSRVAKMLCSS